MLRLHDLTSMVPCLHIVQSVFEPSSFQRQHGSNSNTLSNALSLIQIQVVQTASHNRLACTLCRSCTLFLNLRLPEVSPCSVKRSPTSKRSVYHSIPPTVPDSKIRYSIRKYSFFSTFRRNIKSVEFASASIHATCLMDFCCTYTCKVLQFEDSKLHYYEI